MSKLTEYLDSVESNFADCHTCEDEAVACRHTRSLLLAHDAAIRAEAELTVRKLLWLGHGHVGVYGDDGEMQCGMCAPNYDYKRAPIETVVNTAIKAIRAEAERARLEAIRAFGPGGEQPDPDSCPLCGALTAWRYDDERDMCDECAHKKAEFADDLLAEVDRLRAELKKGDEDGKR